MAALIPIPAAQQPVSHAAASVPVAPQLADLGAQGIIAGCTEIELLVHGDDAGLPYFPTTRLHAEAVAELALTDG